MGQRASARIAIRRGFSKKRYTNMSSSSGRQCGRSQRREIESSTVMRFTIVFPQLLLASFVCHAQDPAGLAREPSVQAALKAEKRIEPKTIEQEIRLCEIPAPPYHENARGEELKRLFTNLGLQDVRVDKAGNVLGTRPGRSLHPHLVVSAHLDTVFPEGTNVKVSRDGTLLKAPGIVDDCRGLAILLAIIQALDEAKVLTP